MRLLIACALLATTGCMETFSVGGSGITKIVTNPPGATARVEGFGECETPCTVSLDAPRNVTIAKAGYLAKRIRLEPGHSKVTVDLELAAPTADVELTQMPEL